MDTRTGEIMASKQLRKRMGDAAYLAFAREVDPSKLSPVRRKQLAETGSTRIGRNDPCPCGSGKKFKKCCIAEVSE